MNRQTPPGITFTLRSPNAKDGRQKFSILKIAGKAPNRSRVTIEVKELAEINRRFLDNTLSFQEAKTLAQDLRRRLDRKENGLRQIPITNKENETVLEAYWKEQYSWRDIRDPSSMRNSLLRAVKALGNVSILTAEQTDFYKKINETKLTNNRKREIIARLNQLIKFARRDFALKVPRRDIVTVKYLSLPEFNKAVKHLDDTDALLATIAFHSGMRVGEIFAIQKSDVLAPGRIKVNKQMLRDGTIAEPKVGKERRTYINSQDGRDAIGTWVKVPLDERREFRNRRFSELISAACQKAFKDDKDKHVTFHDLRHSFAIHMLGLGTSMSNVAQLLGDSIQVTEMFYTGFNMSDESLDSLERQLARNKN
jgi:integrase